MAALTKAVGFLEKSTLLALGPLATATGLTQPLIVQGSLVLTKKAGTNSQVADRHQGVAELPPLLTFVASEGAFEPWPSTPLKPLVLTYVLLSVPLRQVS